VWLGLGAAETAPPATPPAGWWSVLTPPYFKNIPLADL